jgi:hypothetical protein
MNLWVPLRWSILLSPRIVNVQLSHWATLQGLRMRSHLTHTESSASAGLIVSARDLAEAAGLVEACIDQNVAGLAADQPDEITEIGAFIVHVGQEVVLMGLPARHRRIAQSVNLIVIGQRMSLFDGSRDLQIGALHTGPARDKHRHAAVRAFQISRRGKLCE